MEIIPNLHLIEGQASNIYLWDGENGFIMVDAGSPADAKRILAYFEKIGRNPKEIEAIFITHADYDHVGSAAVLQEQSGATVYAGPASASLLPIGKSPKHMPRLLQFFSDHFIKYKSVPEETIRVVKNDQTVLDYDDWIAIATPGHSPDHISFFSATHGILFAGDALNTRGGRLKSSPKRMTADSEQAKESAKRLLVMCPSVLACGHGPPLNSHQSNDLMAFYKELSA